MLTAMKPVITVGNREIRPVAAALFMLAACACFALNSVFVRLATEQGTHPFVAAFFRNLFSLGILLVMTVGRSGFGILKPKRLDLLTLRGTINGASMLAWFYAVPLLPLTDLTALGFTAPLWATVLAVLLLGEVVRWRRWVATLIGFGGVVVILQPGFGEVHWATSLVLFSSAMWALTVIVIRHLTFIRPAADYRSRCLGHLRRSAGHGGVGRRLHRVCRRHLYQPSGGAVGAPGEGGRRCCDAGCRCQRRIGRTR